MKWGAWVASGLSLTAIPWVVNAFPGTHTTALTVERKTCRSADGVTIVYSAAGSGEPGLVFIHGGLADRTFFDSQFAPFAGRHRVIALDLAGHGESGADRRTWGVPQFGGDIAAVVQAERLQRAILFGNSLGGPAALEAALLLPGRVIGVVGIDTFQDLDHPDTADYAKRRAEVFRQRVDAFRADYAGSMKATVAALFHKDADPAVMADAERRMMRTSPARGEAILASIVDYDSVPAARRLTVPLRAINGDLYPTNIAAIRKVKPDFDAIVMKHMGHYPMLERPQEFNRHVATVVEALDRRR